VKSALAKVNCNNISRTPPPGRRQSVDGPIRHSSAPGDGRRAFTALGLLYLRLGPRASVSPPRFPLSNASWLTGPAQRPHGPSGAEWRPLNSCCGRQAPQWSVHRRGGGRTAAKAANKGGDEASRRDTLRWPRQGRTSTVDIRRSENLLSTNYFSSFLLSCARGAQGARRGHGRLSQPL
jgi:hypothetical protein